MRSEDAPTVAPASGATHVAMWRAFLQGKIVGERPGAAGVTQENLPGPETGRYPTKGVKPDLSIHDTGETCRMFVENKFDAPLTPGQPVGYLKALDPHHRTAAAAGATP